MTAGSAGLAAALSGRLGSFELSVDFEAPARGVTALFGPSGCGKTTILRCLAGLLKLNGRVGIGGDVWQDTSSGKFVAPHRREVGYVFQEASLFPHLSVKENLLYGAKRSAGLQPTADGGLAAIVELLGIAHLIERSPVALSGGERQRVALGRALLSRPRVLLMDEPLSALDRMTKENILPYLERIVETVDLPIVYVSHDIAEVARLAKRVVVMKNGHIIRAGPAQDVLSGFDGVRDDHFEAGSILQTRIAAQHEDGLTELTFSGGVLHLPLVEGPIGATVRVRIPAQDVMLATIEPTAISALNVLAATIEDIKVGHGPGALVRLRCGSDHLLTRLTKRSVRNLGLAIGTRCFAIIKSVAIAKADVGIAVPSRETALRPKS